MSDMGNNADLYDILSQMQGGPLPYVPGANSDGLPSPPAQAGNNPGTPSAPTGGGILDLLAAVQQPAAPRPLPQPSREQLDGLAPAALLQFAAAVTRPKQRGESNMGVILDSANTAATSYMNNKKQLEDRAVAKEKERMQMAAADEQLKAARISTVRDVQQIKRAEDRAPLEMEALKQGILKSTNELELQAYQKKAAARAESYAEEDRKLTLEAKNAKTDQDRADAEMKRSHAALYKRQAEEMVELAKMRLAAKTQQPDKYKTVPGLPGEPIQRVNEANPFEKPHYLPMDEVSAWEYSGRKIKVMKETGELKGKDEKAARFEIYKKLVAGTVPKGGDAPMPLDPTGAKPGVVAPAGGAANAETYKQLARQAGQAFHDETTGQVYMPDGRTMTIADYNAVLKARQAGGQARPPSASPTVQNTAQAAQAGSAPAAKTVGEKTGAFAKERQRIEQEMEYIIAATNTPNLSIEQRQALAQQLAAKQAELNKYETR